MISNLLHVPAEYSPPQWNKEPNVKVQEGGLGTLWWQHSTVTLPGTECCSFSQKPITRQSYH